MRIQARQVEAFRAVMLTGGMTAAAETLFVTQPSISRLIKDLEAILGLPLFHRRGNRITPTAEAVDLFSEVERSYLGLELVEKHAGELRGAKRGSLRIASAPAMALGFLPSYIASFVASRPELAIVLDGIPSHLVLERVAAGQFDIGFAMSPAERHSVVLTPIPAAAVVVLRDDHPLAGREELVAENLAGESIVLLGQGSYFRHTVEVALGPAAVGQKIETPISWIACAFVAEGLGVTITDPFTAVDFIGRGLVARRFRPALDVGAALVTPRDRDASRVAIEFIAGIGASLQTYCAKLCI